MPLPDWTLLGGWESAPERLILEEEGYHVLEAGTAADALRLAVAYEGPIHLLLTDVAMPDTTGPELAKQLEGSRPDMEVIYISGLSQSEIADHGVHPGDRCLFKPLTPETLAAAVHDDLDAAMSVATH